MLILLSPAKSLDFDTPPVVPTFTQPRFLGESQTLIDILRAKSPAEIAELMAISDKLAVLNVGRYHDWNPPFTQDNAKQAVLAFDGDVYDGLDASRLDAGQVDWVQRHVRILSGLYGMLRPLDLIQAYRLEMGTKLANPRGKDLYAFWRARLTSELSNELKRLPQRVLINCASDEYSSAIQFNALNARVIQPVFKDWKNDRYKIISFFAKKARGAFVRYAAARKAAHADELKAFDLHGYRFDESASTADTWIFLRRDEAA